MECEGTSAFGERAGIPPESSREGCTLGIRIDGLFISYTLIKSLSFVVYKSLILQSVWSGILKFGGVVRCEWNIFSNFAP